MASTTIVDSYSIGLDNAEIKLKITIQKKQKSKSTVRINKKPVGAGDYDNSFEISLGKADNLLASVLYVDTTEVRMDPDVSEVSFTIELIGGPSPYKNGITPQSIAQGASVSYTVELTLIP